MELEIHDIFLDISKVLDKAWNDGLIFKLCQNDICGEMINILEDFLRNRKKTVVLNGQCFSGIDIRADVPKRSILGPLLFLIYVNDLSNDSNSKYISVADRRSFFHEVQDIDTSANNLNHNLEKNSEWGFQWKMKFSQDFTKQAQEIIFSKKKSIHPAVYFNNTLLNSTAT